ncbi:MAG: hypothetical protein V3U75_08905 [Methylococcaceae bacterium]
MRVSILVVILCFFSTALNAHGLIDDRLHDLLHEIENHPDDHKLYIKRGRIYLDSEQLILAKESFDQAAKLNSSDYESLYWQGMVLFRQGDLNKSLDKLKIYLQKVPNSPAGHKAMAEAMTASGSHSLAANHYDLAIHNDNNPPPQLFIDRLQTQLKIILLPKERIEAGILQGINHHGEIVNFVEAMIDFKIKTHQYEHAIAWFNKLPEKLRDTPKWINKRADVEILSGNRQKALNLYQYNLIQIAKLPKIRRSQLAIKNAEKHAKDRLSPKVP